MVMKYVFLITGSSTGIGYALCQHLAKLDHKILAGYRKASDGERLAQLGKNVVPVALDVTSETDLAQVPDLLKKHLEKDQTLILINNAGVAVWGPLEETPIAEYRQQFEVNLFGCIRLIQLCLPTLRQCKGRIVNISSISGLMASPFMSPYSASKFAMEAIADALRVEVLQQGVKVVNINPGPIRTPIWDKAMSSEKAQNANKGSLYYKSMQKFKSQIEKAVASAPNEEVVVDAVLDAVENDNPKFNYVVGSPSVRALMAIVKFLPKRWILYLVRRV